MVQLIRNCLDLLRKLNLFTLQNRLNIHQREELFFNKSTPRFSELPSSFLNLARSILSIILKLRGKKVSPYFYMRDRASDMPKMKTFIKQLDFHMQKENTQLYANLDDEHKVQMVFDLVWNSLLLEPEPRIHNRLLSLNYLSLERCIGYSQPTNIAWAYLHQFETETQHFELGDSLLIRAANPMEIAFFNQKGISVKSRTKSRFIIETKHSKDFLKREISTDGIRDILNLIVRNQFRDVVSILRILKPSGVGITSVWYRMSLGGVLVETEQVPFPDLEPPVLCPLGEVICNLTNGQVELGKKLWYRLNRARNNSEQYSKILRAIETYDVALCSSRREDIVRDFYVVFETLFSSKGKNLDLEIATLISDTDDEREEFQTFLKDSRGIRDDSTHGSRMKSEVPLDTVTKTANIASEVLTYSMASMEVSEGIDGLAKRAISDDAFHSSLRKKFRRWSPRLSN